ncbi:MAG TPA: tRNA pseudouridine(38-40) synthase TruA [Bacillota bacterium]|nr:tRNA pseudouridine(38-40) synthase TruA [Bacillota bacterium]
MPYRKVKCIVSYDGSNYAGYQIQTNGATVQQMLEEAIERITKEKTTVYASGRTDAGVHAKGQVFHFCTSSSIPVEKWPFAFASQLPHDISVQSAEEVHDSFHARYDVVEKTYRYCVMNRRFPDVFFRRYAWHIPRPLNVEAMITASRFLVGVHDFTSFCSVRSEKEVKVREIYEITFDRDEEGMLWISFRGNGFLYNMVRIMVGTLVKIGLSEKPADSIAQILEAKDRKKAGPTAPPQGLFLWEVGY